MHHDATDVPSVADVRWGEALRQILDDPALRALYAQPIVELTTGHIAGYELLSRFTGPWFAPPDVWFAAAEHWGVNAQLQARVLAAGIAARSLLPADTFLTVNVEPHLLGLPDIASVLMSVPDLSRLVLELTEHSQLIDESVAGTILAHVRDAGGLLALDDAGTGYAGLSKLLNLRPDIVKLDREIISDVDQDPVKRAVVSVFGDLAGQMDSWILAEGIETRDELDTLIGLGVPLGQGYLLGRPAPAMVTELDAELVGHIRATAARTSLRAHVASLIRPATSGRDRATCEVLLGTDGHAAQVRTGRADRVVDGWAPAMSVAPSADLTEVARRAMARDEAYRFAPIVCTDGAGIVLGIIRVDDLLIAVCDSCKINLTAEA